ncbi:2-methylisocitrate lyase-like PEP mutase family enzyme [Nocardioides ginsengisegetis]|uniref:2-methylisocitrate lyase-like PEP mutase family enzyme n=1 Tax=Nocardioides ginsengisegetis TaxID=661491 RepID=A0A7W3IZ87_9ACTN|nr:isocitrate lyase/PEP mutase family protein [Nocardioides ginsengisegetis]MBA8803284.1 2-methylisocitrate lyase-like PEP mutase family enzyme [Nocardioides ginsengisegetis]
MSGEPRPGDRILELLDYGFTFVPGCHDCLSAAVLERAGAQALFVSGAGVAASVAGLPDLGLTTSSELVQMAGSIVSNAKVPVLVDADTGFGNELNLTRAVRAIGRAGAGGLMIEDQSFPKRCGHLQDKRVVSRDDFALRVKTAVSLCAEFGMVLIARTDSLATDGVDEACARAKLAHDLGAHITFVDAPMTLGDVERIGKLPGRKMFNAATGSLTPQLSFDELDELGFSLVIDPCVSLYPTIDGIRRTFEDVDSARGFEPLTRFQMQPRDIFEQVGLDSWLAIDASARGDLRRES